MYDFQELEEKYGEPPRKMDAYLRPLTHTETGDSLPFPTVKLIVATLLIGGLSYWSMVQFELIPHFVGLVSSSVLLGVGIQIVRSASISERNSRLLQESPLVYGRVIQGAASLYKAGTDRGKASVIFTRTDGKCRDTFYLKEVAKKLRAAVEGKNPDPALADAGALVRETSGRAVKLPESIAPDGDCWLGVLEVNPERLPDNKIVKQHLLLLVSPEHNLIAQL